MENENPNYTLRDYSRPSHEGYRNTIEFLDRNNVVPLRSDTIRLVQNGCSFHRLRSEDPNQHLKNFLKLVDSLDLDVANRRTINQSAGGKLCDKNAEKSWALLEDLALYDNKSWNDPGDFTKLVNAISLPQDVLSTSDRRLIELKNQVQRLMEAHLASKSPVQVNKIASSCEICSGPHDTQYCMENPEQTFVENASSHTDKAGGVVRFTNGINEIAYKMPHKIEQFNLLLDLEKEHMKLVYFGNEDDKRRGVDYVMSKILGFYKGCLELGPEYFSQLEEEDGVTLYLMGRSFGVLRSFIWTILG
ncbi:hypothetical protein Tco_0172984 [Tanacetum coccineum]